MTGTAAAATSPVSRLSLVLPPGFVRIAPSDSPLTSIEPIVKQAAANAPQERRTEVARFVRRQLRDAVAAARTQKVTDLVIPTALIAGAALPASLTLARMAMNGEVRTPSQLLISWLARGGTPIELDGLAGVRRVRELPAKDESPAQRQVAYLTHLPWEGQWLLATVTILTSSDPAARETLEAIETLFDAILQTLRVERPEVSA